MMMKKKKKIAITGYITRTGKYMLFGQQKQTLMISLPITKQPFQR